LELLGVAADPAREFAPISRCAVYRLRCAETRP
jgi:hypothetical protein